MIDAGAGVVVGHGPHILRGIEVYKGRPIFYSLANFIFENDLVELQPADSYELLGLEGDSLPSDYFSRRSKNDTTRHGSRPIASTGSRSSQKWFTTLIARCRTCVCIRCRWASSTRLLGAVGYIPRRLTRQSKSSAIFKRYARLLALAFLIRTVSGSPCSRGK